MSAGRRYRAALGVTLRSTAAAYGYTLATASSLAELAARDGSPRTGELFLFAGGGLTAFAVLEAVLLGLPGAAGEPPKRALPFVGALNFAAVTAALGCTVGLTRVVGAPVVWLVAPLGATAAYLLGVADRVAAVAGRGR